MTGLLPLLLLATVLGARHATDADHVVAVTTIITHQRRVRDAVRIGVLWGIGHTATLLVVGGAIILLNVIVPPRLGLALEFVVAVMLIGLGGYNLLDRPADATPSMTRPVLVGGVHGLAGSAAVALLVLAAIPGPGWAVGYLLLFGLGTIAGMMAITLGLVTPMAWSMARFANVNRGLRLASGYLSIVFGTFLAIQLGLGTELFGLNLR